MNNEMCQCLNWRGAWENKRVIFFSLSLSISLSITMPRHSTANKEKALQKCVLIYMSKHTFPMLIFCTVVLLSPTEGGNSKLLTQWFQIPDKGPYLIGFHSVSVNLIGWDYGIDERIEMRGESWNWNEAEMPDHACLIICWLTLSAGGLLYFRRKPKQVWYGSDLNVRILLFIFGSSYRQQRTQYAYIYK